MPQLDTAIRAALVATLFGLVSPPATAQNAPGAVPREAPGVEPIAPGAVPPGETAELVTAYAEMSCTQLGDSLRWLETRAMPQQIAAWNAAVNSLPQVDARARHGEYLRIIEDASVKALRELLMEDAVSLSVSTLGQAAESVDRSTYLQWIKTSKGDVLDELAKRVTASLGLKPGMQVADWNSPQWNDLVRRRAAEQAERMRLEGVFRSPYSAFALKRILALIGPAQKVKAVAEYFATVLGAWAPLLAANNVASSNANFVAARARELSSQMREGERMRLSYALRCGKDSVADAHMLGNFSGRFTGWIGEIDFSPDGSYVLLSAFGQRFDGRFKLEGERIFLSKWAGNQAEQWLILRGNCLYEPILGAEMFCRGG